MPLWGGADYSAPLAGAVLHLTDLPAVLMPLQLPGPGALVWDTVSPSPWVCRHSSGAVVPRPSCSTGASSDSKMIQTYESQLGKIKTASSQGWSKP